MTYHLPPIDVAAVLAPTWRITPDGEIEVRDFDGEMIATLPADAIWAALQLWAEMQSQVDTGDRARL